MSYLQDYLRVIPKVEKEKVEALLRANKALYEVKNLTEKEFENLVNFLAIKQQSTTKPMTVDDVVDAAKLNEFFSNVGIDLLHLFEEQNLIEGAALNYDRIFMGVLDDIRKEVSALKQREEDLFLENKGEDGLVIRSYSFEEENKGKHAETMTKENSYLFEDRNGDKPNEVSYERSYHQHFIGLPKEKEINCLVNDKGQTTAKIKIDYQNTGTIKLNDSRYDASKAIDGNQESYYMHVVLATTEATHKIPKHPDLDKLK